MNSLGKACVVMDARNQGCNSSTNTDDLSTSPGCPVLARGQALDNVVVLLVFMSILLKNGE